MRTVLPTRAPKRTLNGPVLSQRQRALANWVVPPGCNVETGSGGLGRSLRGPSRWSKLGKTGVTGPATGRMRQSSRAVPVPVSKRKEKDAFQVKALALLKQRADCGERELSYEEFLVEDGRRWLRYAKGQIMIESCVKCHNESEKSPKRDWKVGDLVGVLEVTRPLDREIERTRRGLQGAFLLMGGTGIVLAGLSLGLVLATRRRDRGKVPG